MESFGPVELFFSMNLFFVDLFKRVYFSRFTAFFSLRGPCSLGYLRYVILFVNGHTLP